MKRNKYIIIKWIAIVIFIYTLVQYDFEKDVLDKIALSFFAFLALIEIMSARSNKKEEL